MPVTGGLVFPHRLAALSDALANTLFTVKVESVLAGPADAEFRQGQRFIASGTLLQFACFYVGFHHNAPFAKPTASKWGVALLVKTLLRGRETFTRVQ